MYSRPKARLAGDAAAQSPSLRALIIIALVALAAMTPELALGLTVTDNFRFNLLWPEQFGELFRAGHLYPRWLPHSWGGLGSPNFYFYPPLFFWVTALVDVVTGGALSPERFVPIGSLILLIASGLAMRAWLRIQVGEQPAVLGAVTYMLAPYHLYDLYGRGALAEASAYASLPVVMLALARLVQNRPRYLPVLALGYGALLFSHLPTALLVSLFLIPPYVVWLAIGAARPIQFVTRALLGGLIGIALAAIYLLPALELLPHVSPTALSGSFYRPENWFFWHVRAGIMGARMYLIVPVSIAAFLFAAGTAFGVRAKPYRREPLFWSALTIIFVVLIAGVIPGFWKLPGLMLVQFPWRALLLVEFTTVTMVVTCVPSPRNPFVLGGTVVLANAYAVLALMAGHTIARTWDGQGRTAAEIRAEYLDAPEYLPSGTRIEQGEGPDDVHISLPKLPLASADYAAAKISVSEANDGGMAVTVDSPAATRLILRRFYFPHWQVHDAAGRLVPIISEPRQRVVSFAVPAGKSAFRLDPGNAPFEILARWVTLATLVILLLITGMTLPAAAKKVAED